MKHTTGGVDIAKSVMQLRYIDAQTGEIVNKPVKRAAFLEPFANLAPCMIGMEACGGSQHWARKLTTMGHEVKLMPGKFVKAFVMGNKNDAADAKAIWLAVLACRQIGCGKDGNATGGAGTASDARAVSEVPHDADQQSARPADRVRRSDGLLIFTKS